MIHLTAFLSLIIHLSLFSLTGNSPQQGSKWKPLFDGKTLKGWHTIPGGKWEVINGAIVGTSPKSDERHGLLVTDQKYRDFVAKLKFKVLKGDSGFYFRIDEVGGTVGVNGFQAELDDQWETGGLYETGGRAWVTKPDSANIKKWTKLTKTGVQDWNELTVSAEGANIKVWLNGNQVSQLTNDPGRREGHIALQLHGSQDMHVQFKDIRIQEK
jgi:hypothetical protein